MKTHALVSLCALALSVCLSGCEAEEGGAPAPPTEYVQLEVTAPAEGEGGSVVMTQASCSNDPDTGLFEGSFSGDDDSMLTIKIKGFSTSGGSYTCSQASDNTEEGVGNKFDSCAVELVVADPETSTNTYAMHRETEDAKAFTYAGACTIGISYEEPVVNGTIDCGGLVQTVFQGAPRNPIDPDVTAHIASGSTFFCDL